MLVMRWGILNVTTAEPVASVPPTRRIELSVEGMTCAACSGAVERALHNAHSGVLDVQASTVRCFSWLFEVYPPWGSTGIC